MPPFLFRELIPNRVCFGSIDFSDTTVKPPLPREWPGVITHPHRHGCALRRTQLLTLFYFAISSRVASAHPGSGLPRVCPQSSIGFWETASETPRSDILPKLAKALGVRVEGLPGSAPAHSTRAPRPRRRAQRALEQPPCCHAVSRSWWSSSSIHSCKRQKKAN